MIYRARRLGPNGFQRDCVLKLMAPHLAQDAKYVALFAKEARLLAELNHPSIVHVEEFAVYDSLPYIAMESLDGIDLQQLAAVLFSRKKPLPVELALGIAGDLAAALAFAHGKAIVHGDVSPSNFMLCKNGALKLLDFGVAKVQGHVSSTDTFRGKLGYMAPEQIDGSPVDARSDVFAVGIILYELLTGQPLFTGEHEGETVRRLRDFSTVVPASQLNASVPRLIDRIVEKALARLPEARYRDAGELNRALVEVGLVGEYWQSELDAFVAREVPRLWCVERKENVSTDDAYIPDLAVVDWLEGPPTEISSPPTAAAVFFAWMKDQTHTWRGRTLALALSLVFAFAFGWTAKPGSSAAATNSSGAPVVSASTCLVDFHDLYTLGIQFDSLRAAFVTKRARPPRKKRFFKRAKKAKPALLPATASKSKTF